MSERKSVMWAVIDKFTGDVLVRRGAEPDAPAYLEWLRASRQPIWGCAGCSTTAGLYGCPEHGRSLTYPAYPATPPASETVEAAWEALLGDSDIRSGNVLWVHAAVARHRPRIEAAIRAKADGTEATRNAYRNGVIDGRAEADERVAALREVVARFVAEYDEDTRRAPSFVTIGLARAALSDADREDA